MLQITTNPDDRKEIARKMNDLFAEASTIKKQAKHRHYMEASLEREFISIRPICKMTENC